MEPEKVEVRRAPPDFPWFAGAKNPPILGWMHAGVLCAVAYGFNALNGYVRLPENHPWFAITDYDQIPAEVHGGITFGQKPGSPEQTYDDIQVPDENGVGPVVMPARRGRTAEEIFGWIGFDTAHAWDYWPAEELVLAGVDLTEKNVALMRTLDAEMEERYPDRNRIVWTMAALIAEVEELARQVADAARDQGGR